MNLKSTRQNYREKMSCRYRYEDPPGCCRPTRTWRKWLIAFEDGEEIYSKKEYALRLGKISLKMGKDVHVYEETITRTINHSTREIAEDKFRIDITQRLKTEILLENIDNKEKRI